MGTLTLAASGPGTGTGALVVVVLLASYAAACAFWPFSACGRCSGTGKRRSPSGRIGRRVFSALNPGRDPERPWSPFLADLRGLERPVLVLGRRRGT